jgi:hypothetical protein
MWRTPTPGCVRVVSGPPGIDDVLCSIGVNATGPRLRVAFDKGFGAKFGRKSAEDRKNPNTELPMNR